MLSLSYWWDFKVIFVLPDFSLMTSLLDSHTTTVVKPDVLSSVQNGNGIPLDKSIYAAFPMRAHTEKTNYIYMGV